MRTFITSIASLKVVEHLYKNSGASITEVAKSAKVTHSTASTHLNHLYNKRYATVHVSREPTANSPEVITKRYVLTKYGIDELNKELKIISPRSPPMQF